MIDCIPNRPRNIFTKRTLSVDDYDGDLTIIYRGLIINDMGILVYLTNDGWLMISWGIILPNIWGIIVIQWGIPYKPGFNEMRDLEHCSNMASSLSFSTDWRVHLRLGSEAHGLEVSVVPLFVQKSWGSLQSDENLCGFGS